MSVDQEYLPDGTFIVDSPRPQPDVFDLIIVGGGPAGTAAALHGTELGLAVLVIDYDDLMKRIRDYPKDKLILPDFGGGDKMKFPKAGELVSALHFEAIDKDEMCVRWKSLYRKHNIPARIGIELLGLERRTDATWQVRCFNHNTKTEQAFVGRHIVIGIGRGVPRRFDIPGNSDGIAYRLSDSAPYVGQPACVIGGGTSAAEAVIAISQAKVKAKDPSAVYWSYRGDKLPKVSKALADVFFEAYLGNGNIRYHPNSEPVAVVTAEDRKDYLSIRTDRRCIPGRPNETVHMEFMKEHCIACIGEDIPEAFLSSMGITMLTGGQANKKRMTVTPLLETQQPNVYLIGDLLSQAYLQTEDFGANPASFLEIKHRGNIKAAMVDGVFVVDVISQRLAGKKDVKVDLQFEEEGKKPAVARDFIEIVVETEGPPKESVAPARAVEEGGAYLVRIIAGSVEEDEYPLHANGTTTIGRKECDIRFPEDLMLSERHASISHGPDGYFLRDDASANGVFYRLPEGRPIEISEGDLVRLGRQFLLFADGSPSFTHYDQAGKLIKRYPLSEKTVVLGREAPDITLNHDDGTMSRRHISVTVKENKILVKDLKSLNGTYLKVRNALRIGNADQFRAGSQAFKLIVREELVSDRIHTKISPPVSPRPQAPPPIQAPAPAPQPAAPGKKSAVGLPQGAIITFKDAGKSVTYEKGQTICEIAEKSGIEIVAECHAGICGSDPIRILAGSENLNPIGNDEKGTLEDICGLAPGECRLACMARPAGPAVVEIVKT